MFNMVTLDLQRNDGDIKIQSKNIDEIDIINDGIKYGTCPQYNTIWETLTVDETLRFMAQVKGLAIDDAEF